jgi:surface protein
MFAYATSFDRSFADWNISNETDMRGIFTGADDAFEVQVQVQYDNFPDETGWMLQDSNGTLISSQPSGSVSTKGGTVSNTSSVTGGTYTFEMTDTLGDGICCRVGSGGFSIAVNGETVVRHNGRFGDIVQETFVVQAPTPSRFLSFETTEELREAVDLYLANNGKDTLVARNYGWPIGIWNVSKIQDFSYLFAAFDYDGDDDAIGDSERFTPNAIKFNEDISNWTMSSATSMTFMFYGAASFDQPLADWNVSSVTDMLGMFSLATDFNQPIGNWDVSSVTSMIGMFSEAKSFNQPIGNWNVSSVMTTSYMFEFATVFNQPLGNWDVSSVADMSQMFGTASSFNQPIGNWDVSSVTDMEQMFWEASSYNQPIGNWNVSSVKYMYEMFYDALSFNQPI